MKSCTRCDAPVPDDSPEGLCARCLVSVAMKGGDDIDADSQETQPATAAGTRRGGAPIDIGDPAQVAKRLPQFEILELLGRGGMGVVYKARQIQLDRIVALKILPPDDATSAGFVERFRREARSLAKLGHANIVSVYDFGESNGLYYFVMEYVDGVNLRQLIRDRRLTPAEALALVPKICDALQFAHEEGIIHRDIKPENILIDRKGRVKIADFGLAKLLGRAEVDPRLTVSGAVLGTPRYMAPEQVEKPDSVDHRADIYSLGVVFYEMLTGEIPMGRFALPSQKVQIDVRLDEVVLHALERDVKLRYQQAREVRDDVEHITSKPPADSSAASSGEKNARHEKKAGSRFRFPIGYLVLCSLMFAAAGYAALAFWNHGYQVVVAAGGVLTFIAIYASVELSRRVFPQLGGSGRRDLIWISALRSLAVLGFCFVGAHFLLDGAYRLMERTHWTFAADDVSRYQQKYQGREYELLRLLKRYAQDVPPAEFSTVSQNTAAIADPPWSLGEGQPYLASFDAPRIAAAFAIALVVLAFAARILAARDLPEVPGAWRMQLWPTFLIALAMPIGWAAVAGAMNAIEEMQRRTDSPQLNGIGSSFWVNAPLKEVGESIKNAINAEGYRADNMPTWSIQTVPQGTLVAYAGFTNAWMASPFQRWRWHNGTLVNAGPNISVEFVSLPTERPAQTWVTVSLNQLTNAHTDRQPWPSVSDRLIAAAKAPGNGGSMVVAPLNINSPKANLRSTFDHPLAVFSVSFTHDSAIVATGCGDNAIRLWDVASGTNKATISTGASGGAIAAISPDGQHAASRGGDENKDLLVYSVATGQLVKTLIGHTAGILAVTFSPDGKRLASASVDNTVRVWAVPEWSPVYNFDSHENAVTCLSFNRDGTLLASGSQDKTVRVWSLTSGTCVTTLQHPDEVTAVALSPDGKTLASGAFATLRLWDLSNGKSTFSVQAESSTIRALALSPDGRTIATAGMDDDVRLWDTAALAPIVTFKAHLSSIIALAFSPDSKTLASSGWDRTARLWNVERPR